MLDADGRIVLNEVLSLNAQEWQYARRLADIDKAPQ